MTAKDTDTLGFYAREAETYASRGREPAVIQLDQFLAHLPAGASILELGCGGGQDSRYMLDRGYDVHPTDGTPELAAEAAKRLNHPVSVLLFEDINAQAQYHGIFANACLLHVPRAALPAIIGKIHTALKPSGTFYASYKAGEAEGRDRFDRFYNYPSEQWLRELYAQLGWSKIEITERSGSGYDNEPTNWLHVTATK